MVTRGRLEDRPAPAMDGKRILKARLTDFYRKLILEMEDGTVYQIRFNLGQLDVLEELVPISKEG